MTTDRVGAARRAAPYSDQYETIVGRGHTRPTATFAAPTLIWHVGVWPRRRLNGEAGGAFCDPHDTADKEHDKAQELYRGRRRAWLEEIDRTLETIEEAGRLRRGQPGKGRPKRFLVKTGVGKPPLVDVGSVGMELWWRDPADAKPDQLDNAIRVRLQVDLTADYVTYCFYLDVSRTWDGRAGAGKRRNRLLAATASVQSICSVDRRPRPMAARPPTTSTQ